MVSGESGSPCGIRALAHRYQATALPYPGDAGPSVPGGMTAIYRDLAANVVRTRQVTADVAAALAQGRNCLILTNWTARLQKLADALREMGHDPVVLRGGMGAKSRAAALSRLQSQPGGPPLLVVATGPYAGEGCDCPDWTRSSSPRPSPQGTSRLVQYAGRILRPYDGKTTAEVHHYHGEQTGVLAALAKRPPATPASASPDPRRLAPTPSASTAKPVAK